MRSFITGSLISALLLVGCAGSDDEPSLPAGHNVAGVVLDENGAPLPGVTVTVHGVSGASTTTNASGQWSLEAPEGSPQIVATMSGYWGGSLRVRLATGQTITDIEIEVLSDTFVADIGTGLGRTIDAASGVVVVDFYVADSTAGGESATLSVAADAPVTIDAMGAMVPSSSIVAGGEPVLIFTNAATGNFEIFPSGNGSTTGCAPEFDGVLDGFAVSNPKVITHLNVYCGLV